MRKALFFAIAALVCVLALSGGLPFFFRARSDRLAAAEAAEAQRTQGARVSVAGEEWLESSQAAYYSSSLDSSGSLQPSFQLEAGESALLVLTADINLDGTYDQACAVRRGADAEIYIVCAIQDPVTSSYARLAPVRTGVSQRQTMLMYFSDVTGRQKNALVYSGMNSKGHQVLGIFSIEEEMEAQGGFALKELLKLEADGSIQVEEARRSESYNLGMAAGASYPVVSYHSIDSEGEERASSAQIRRTYAWNPLSGVYELSAESRVSAETAGAAIVQRLREEGNDALFRFFKGVWYKTGGSSQDLQIGFDLAAGEIVFADGQTHEIFTSESVSARRYGVYLVAQNNLISSIRRLIDIEITGADEMRVLATDDVRLRIGVDSDWSGSYRRLRGAAPSPESGAKRIAAALEGAKSGWTDSSGAAYFFEGGVLASKSANGEDREESKYAIYMTRDAPIMQVRDSSGKTAFYLLREEADGRIAMQEATATAADIKAKNVPEIKLRAIALGQEAATSEGEEAL